MQQKLFSERLNEFMDEYELNETTLSEKIKMSRVSVSNILNGAHCPSTSLIDIERLYNLSEVYRNKYWTLLQVQIQSVSGNLLNPTNNRQTLPIIFIVRRITF